MSGPPLPGLPVSRPRPVAEGGLRRAADRGRLPAMNRCRTPLRPAGLIALLAGLYLLAQALVLGTGGAEAMPFPAAPAAHALHAGHESAGPVTASPARSGHPCAPGDGLARIACLQHCTLAPVSLASVLRLPPGVAPAEPLRPAPLPAGHVPGVPERPPR